MGGEGGEHLVGDPGVHGHADVGGADLDVLGSRIPALITQRPGDLDGSGIVDGNDLGIMLSLVGATGSVVVTYLLPGFCYYRLCRQPRSWMRRAALLQTLLGAILMPVSLALIMTKK